MKSKYYTTTKIVSRNEKGVSLIELLVVVAILTILSSLSIYNFAGNSRLFKPEEESLKLIDLLQEARQRSLTQRETMRVEIDLTDSAARLIDENTPSTETDDKKIREIRLYPNSDVKLNSQPPDVSTFPPENFTVPSASFQLSVYPPSVTHNVCTLRFMRDGTVFNAGTNPTASGASATGSTIFIWSLKQNTADQSDFVRAISIIGTTGSIRLWEYDRNSSSVNKWKDSRRTGVYGQTGSTNANN